MFQLLFVLISKIVVNFPPFRSFVLNFSIDFQHFVKFITIDVATSIVVYFVID